MKKAPSLKLPQTPTYQSPQGLSENIDWFNQEGRGLTSGDFTGSRAWLADLVNYNPESTRLALSSAQGFLTPLFNQLNQDVTNQAAAGGALTGSGYTDALSRNAYNLESQLQGITSQAALDNLNQANANRLGLYQYGAGLIGQGSALAQGAADSQNSFNLSNYSNLVANAVNENNNAKNPGFFGNLWSSFSPVGHDIYSAQGYNVPGMSTQQALLTAASMGQGGGMGRSSGGFGGGSYGWGNPYAQQSYGGGYYPGSYAGYQGNTGKTQSEILGYNTGLYR